MGLTAKTCTPCQGGVEPLSKAQAEELLKDTPRWRLSYAGDRLKRSFEFDNFATALDFVNRVGALAEAEGHHPDITFGWGYATIEIWTHKIGGLHENDFILAAKISELLPA